MRVAVAQFSQLGNVPGRRQVGQDGLELLPERQLAGRFSAELRIQRRFQRALNAQRDLQKIGAAARLFVMLEEEG